MDGLDQIPWKDLTHAYGSAADVPDLLRALRTASPDLKGEDSPLWHLYGNIWHQGTVYEATAYAVPFLVELAANSQTPDRVGILALLAEIASSYRDVRGNARSASDFPPSRSQELHWAQRTRDAVAVEFSRLSALTKEPGDVGCAAANVLARFPDRGAEAAAAVRELLGNENRSAQRAGLLLMLGSTGDRSPVTAAVLSAALHAAAAAERHAAVYSIVRLNTGPLPEAVNLAIMDAIATDDLEASVQHLPWNATGGLDASELFASLDATHQDRIIDRLIDSLEAGTATTHGVATLINLLFPPAAPGPTPQVTPAGMSARQSRAVRALYEAMKGGKRIFYGHFPCWGLPDTMREWRELAGKM